MVGFRDDIDELSGSVTADNFFNLVICCARRQCTMEVMLARMCEWAISNYPIKTTALRMLLK